MKDYLFVGGPWDGLFKEMGGYAAVNVPDLSEPETTWYADPEPPKEPVLLKMHYYELKFVRNNGVKVEFYLHGGIPISYDVAIGAWCKTMEHNNAERT